MREAPAIEAFGGGGFRIAGDRYEGSVLILDDRARPWPATTFAALRPADLALVFAAPAGSVEFILLGAGTVVAPPPRALREAAAAAGMGLEVMSTPEACRLYNVLAADGRRIAAALLAV